ncbi:hypothetical protein C8Q76DRAFT_707039 [Earliella scabrosa]|nr:hypothetical protein C8Q76DRAFT_707039 [Earliella scabrosa]
MISVFPTCSRRDLRPRKARSSNIQHHAHHVSLVVQERGGIQGPPRCISDSCVQPPNTSPEAQMQWQPQPAPALAKLPLPQLTAVLRARRTRDVRSSIATEPVSRPGGVSSLARARSKRRRRSLMDSRRLHDSHDSRGVGVVVDDVVARPSVVTCRAKPVALLPSRSPRAHHSTPYRLEPGISDAISSRIRDDVFVDPQKDDLGPLPVVSCWDPVPNLKTAPNRRFLLARPRRLVEGCRRYSNRLIQRITTVGYGACWLLLESLSGLAKD